MKPQISGIGGEVVLLRQGPKSKLADLIGQLLSVCVSENSNYAKQGGTNHAHALMSAKNGHTAALHWDRNVRYEPRSMAFSTRPNQCCYATNVSKEPIPLFFGAAANVGFGEHYGAKTFRIVSRYRILIVSLRFRPSARR
ncbi:hypothetical protein POI8812_01047 [Pontivivens insulae]|uniref:Uncharacterized protein n=1 Tax=Pontivivens insulae TaxID=1639689 RepID=A0A2R8A944_9RHOB|nr:hypothetical protein DFR53_1046 [Pontivivens insulae]SPF28744.1 hypothetical protein POI8812_01047 [Pontivivens insulae]